MTTQKGKGDTFDVAAHSKADPAQEASVQCTLVSFASSTHLPEGCKRDDVATYNEEYNKENDLYTIDESGNLSEGWFLVTVSLSYQNDNDFDCRVSLGNLSVSAFDSDQNLVKLSELDPWIIGGKNTQSDYYLPVLAAHQQAEFSVGFFIPSDAIAKDNLLVMEQGTDQGVTQSIKAFSLGSLREQGQDASSGEGGQAS